MTQTWKRFVSFITGEGWGLKGDKPAHSRSLISVFPLFVQLALLTRIQVLSCCDVKSQFPPSDLIMSVDHSFWNQNTDIFSDFSTKPYDVATH